MRFYKNDSNLFLPSNRIYIGIDESNHGRFPEYFVSVFSGLEIDVIKGNFGKIRTNSSSVQEINKSQIRDYSFLLVTKSDYGRISQNEFIGIVVASLISGFVSSDLESIGIFLDGEHLQPRKTYLRDSVSEICEVPKSLVSLTCGKGLDKKYKVVNMADDIAHYLFRKCTAEMLSKDSKIRHLLR